MKVKETLRTCIGKEYMLTVAYLRLNLTMSSLRTCRMSNPQTNSPQMKRVQLTLMPGIIKHSFS